MATYGYARVSSKDQNLDRQTAALIQAGVDAKNIFYDKASGKDFQRKEYCRLVKKIKEGDTLVVLSLDRFGRDYDEIRDQWTYLTKKKGVNIVVMDMPLLNTATASNELSTVLLADIVLNILSYVAHIERDHIKERQAQGIAQAHIKGVRFGRPSKKPYNWYQIQQLILEEEASITKVAHDLGVNKSTIYRWLNSGK